MNENQTVLRKVSDGRILDLMSEHGWDHTRAAKALNVKRVSLSARLKAMKKRGILALPSTNKHAIKHDREFFKRVHEVTIEHEFNYKKVAASFGVTYFCVYNWIHALWRKGFPMPDFSDCADVYDKRNAIAAFLKAYKGQ